MTVRDVWAAATELITNTDDSYKRLAQKTSQNRNLYGANKNHLQGGPVTIELYEKKNEPCQLIIHDNAEGISPDQVQESLISVGNMTSSDNNRGFFGSGLRDCANIGSIYIESIFDEHYYKWSIIPSLNLNDEPDFTVVDSRLVRPKDRLRLLKPTGNGTSVTIILKDTIVLPRIETWLKDFAYCVALRDILSEDSPTKLFIQKQNDLDSRKKISYPRPAGTKIFDEKVVVDGYPQASARLLIWKTDQALSEVSDKRFSRFGIVVKGVVGVYENTLLDQNNPNMKFIFGRLECDYIDKLMREYEIAIANKESLNPNNNMELSDASRNSGLNRNHPFTKALLKPAAQSLHEVLTTQFEQTQDKHKYSRNVSQIFEFFKNQASDYFSDEDEDELSQDPRWKQVLDKDGISIYPNCVSDRHVGEERNFTIYVKASNVSDDKVSLNIIEPVNDVKFVEIIKKPTALTPHSKIPGVLKSNFRVKFIKIHPKDDVSQIEAKVHAIPNGLIKADLIISIIKRVGLSKLSFERPNGYRAITNSIMYAKLLAPGSFEAGDKVTVSSDKPHIAVVSPRKIISKSKREPYVLEMVDEQLSCLIHVDPKKEGNTVLSAEINGQTAYCDILVVDPRSGDKPLYEIIFSDHPEPGISPYQWTETNKLELFRNHSSISRLFKMDETGTSQEFSLQLYPILRDALVHKKYIKNAQYQITGVTDPQQIAVVLHQYHQTLQKEFDDNKYGRFSKNWWK